MVDACVAPLPCSLRGVGLPLYGSLVRSSTDPSLAKKLIRHGELDLRGSQGHRPYRCETGKREEMTRFNSPSHKAKAPVSMATSPIATVSRQADTRTFEGAAGWTRTAQAELFLLASGAFLDGKGSFYESGEQQDARLRQLVTEVAVEHPQWCLDFATWLRGPGNIRAASIMFAADVVKVRLGKPGLSDNEAGELGINRRIIDAVCQRADEPGEMLAYWTSQYGRRIPKPVKRGVADAVRRLYNERSLLKWDSDSKAYRFGDVLELVHPTPDPDKPNQGALFKYAIDHRHKRVIDVPMALGTIQHNGWLREQSKLSPGLLLESDQLKAAGMTWEDALSLAGQHGLDKRRVWEAMIPSMQIFALVRNLRNFDEAGVSDEMANYVMGLLKSPDTITKSRMLPFRFLAAYRAANASLRWSYTLEKALNLSLSNVPHLSGRTLIAVDRSPSMFPEYDYAFPHIKKSDISRADQAAVFGAALALRAENPTLVWFGGQSFEVGVPKGGSVLKLVDSFGRNDGTDIPSTIKRHYAGHDRVIVLTDEQTRQGYFPSNMRSYGGMETTSIDALVPQDVPVYMWNFAGYTASAMPSGTAARFTMGGLSDSAFALIPRLEAGVSGGWPWETEAGLL